MKPGETLPHHHVALLARALHETPLPTLEKLFEAIGRWGAQAVAGREWGAWLTVGVGGRDPVPVPDSFHRPENLSRDLQSWAMGLHIGRPCVVERRDGEVVPRTVVRAAWSPAPGCELVLWLTVPGATRREDQEVLTTLLTGAMSAAAAKGKERVADLRLETPYSRDKFERNLERIAGTLADFILLAPIAFTDILELLALQLDAYLGETFGEGAEEAFLDDLRALAAADEKERSLLRRAVRAAAPYTRLLNRWQVLLAPGRRLPLRSSRGTRTAKTYARLLHLRAVLFTPGQTKRLHASVRKVLPPALGNFLPDAGRPWLDALGELLLAHWIGSADALRLAGRTCELRTELARLGWAFGTPGKKAGARAPASSRVLESVWGLLAGAAMRRYGAGRAARGVDPERRLRFWDVATAEREGPDPEPGKGAAAATVGRLERLFTRWLVLHRLLDLELVEITRETFRAESRLVRILDRLWPKTREAAFLWLLLHKQWSTPAGVDLDAGAVRRAAILHELERCRDGEHPLDSVARLEPDEPLTLHVDPLWTNLYLVHRLLRHLGPGLDERVGDLPARWEALRREVPTPAGQRRLLRHLSRAVVFLLWQLLQHERLPHRYAIVPPAEDPEEALHEAGVPGETANGERRAEEWLSEGGQDPVGPERYAESLIYLMDVFGHAVLHVEREVDIAGYLSRVIESELLLHAVSDYYRDHLFHLVDLAVLGDLLLTARSGRRTGYLWQLLAPSPAVGGPQPYRLDVLRRQWFVAAVFHDVGYLFSLVARMPELLREQGSRSHERFVRAIGEAFRGEVEALEREILDLTRHLADRRVGLDRGVHSAVILRDHLREAVRPARADGGPLAAYAPSLRGICQHSLHREEISQDQDPLSFLMALCDELTDWGRTRVRARELRRFTVFQPKLVANWQGRRIPVLTELLMPMAGLEGGTLVIDTPEGGIGDGAQPFTRRRRYRLDVVQLYHQDEVGYLNPVYLWVLRARNLERLRPSQKGGPALAIRIFTLTGVPYRLRKAETVHAALLEEIAVRHPRLRLGDLVRTLEHCFEEALQAEVGRKDAVNETVGRINAELGGDAAAVTAGRRPRARSRTVELQVFDLESLCKEQPLRGFDQGRDLELLAQAFQQVLEEREEQRRLRGLRALRSGQLRP